MNYYIYGTEQALIQEKLRDILTSFSAEEQENMTVIDGMDKEFNVDMILEALNTVSLFSMDNKIVVVRNPSFLAGRRSRRNDEEEDEEEEAVIEKDDPEYKKLSSYLNDSATFSTLITCFYEDSYVLNKKGKYHRLLQKKCKAIQANQPDAREFADIVRRDIRQSGLSIDARAVNLIIDRLDANLTNWKQELAKLETYGERIREKDVRYLIHRSLEDDAFELTNALMRKDLRRSLNVLHDLMENTKNISGLMPQLVGLVAASLRDFYQAAYLSRTMDRNEISAETGISTGRLYYILENKKYFSASDALKLLDKLADLDHRMKLDEIDQVVGFELFLYEATR